MKKAKILIPLLTSCFSVGTIIPTLAGCSCKKKTTDYIQGGETDIKIVGNDVYNYFVFTLTNALDEGQTLTTNLTSTDYFTYDEPIIENKLVSVAVVWSMEEVKNNITETNDIKFTCKNSDGSVAWEQTVTNCSVTYSPNIVLKSDTKVLTSNLEDNSLTYEFEFELGEELSEVLSLKPWFTNVSPSSFTIDETKSVFNVEGTTAKLTVVGKKNTSVAEGDKFSFNLQIECLAREKWTYWQSIILSDMSVGYIQDEIDLDERCFLTIKEDEESTDLTFIGIDTNSEYYSDKANTLVLPAKTDEKWIRYVGKAAGEKINLPSNITKIKIAGIGIQEIRANAFLGNTNIKFIDFEAIDDTVKSLDTVLKFNSNSFANWNSKGSIIWNKDISQYKRHIVKEKLYKAGLTSADWFGYTEVDNLSALKEAAYTGGNIILTGDIEITPDEEYTGQINFYTSSILDLNGHTIKVKDGTRPIFNTAKKEFAVIGVWDCELVVTDSSSGHSGSIKAFDNSNINSTSHPFPTDTKGENEDDCWEWDSEAVLYRPREMRTFYVRSDIPTRAKGTLEILAGNFYGNCTNVLNWNTTVYIEDEYSSRTGGYKGEYAPTFNLFSKCFSYKDWHSGFTEEQLRQQAWTTSDPCKEMFNCQESTCKSGQATFELWGGKFMGYSKLSGGAETGEMAYYIPSENTADHRPDPEKSGEYIYANWTQTADGKTHYSYEPTKEQIAEKGYVLLIPNDEE